MQKAKQNKTITSILFLLGIIVIIFYGVLVLVDVYSRENNLMVNLEQINDVKKGDEIVLDFSTKVNGRIDLNKIFIEPTLDFKPYLLSNKRLGIKILGVPQPDIEYKIFLSNVPTFWLDLNKNISTSIYSPKTSKITVISPRNGETEVAYDTKVKINLDRSLNKKMFLEVDFNPNLEVQTILGENRDNIILIPKQKLLKSQRYDITITAKYRDDENFSKKLYQGFFVTKIPPQVVYNFNNDGVSNKTEDITWDIIPKISDGRYIDIDLTHQVMSIFQDGLRKGSYKVSSGKRGMNTPTGTFHILSKRRRPWSAHYGLYMPWYMGFTTKGHGIHELPEWPSGYKEGANHLGIPVSHGCVRLGIGPAKLIYDFSKKGTPVVVHY
jgi:lipoprotein-anchoring transpeptidase ErfK/SrfK